MKDDEDNIVAWNCLNNIPAGVCLNIQASPRAREPVKKIKWSGNIWKSRNRKGGHMSGHKRGN